MFKRHKIVLASLVVITAPFLPGIAAGDANEWSELPVSKIFEYSDYRVERLSSSSNVVMKFGDTLVRVDRASACSSSCTLRDMYVLQNGGAIKVSNIPTNALDEWKVMKNDGRLVYAEFSNDEHTRINVIEVDLATGVKTTLLEDTFLTNALSVDVFVEDEMIYVQATFDHSNANDMYPQSSIYVYNPRFRAFKQLSHQWDLQREELMDLQDGHAIVKMTFPGGEEQLWVYDYVEAGEPSSTAVPKTWTPDVEDIVAAHYTPQGSIEYFKMYARTVSDKALETTTVFKDYLNWFRPYDTQDLRNIVQVNENKMAWLTPENDLYVSDGLIQYALGNIGGNGTFTLLKDKILFGNGSTGGVQTLSGETLAKLDFTPTDILDDAIVGTNGSGQVIYKNLTTGKQITVGFGDVPHISDDRHIYWKGTDGHLYQASVYLSAAMDTPEGTPVKTATSAKVYLVTDGTAAYVPNEAIYYTWFASFGSVAIVSDATLATYDMVDAVGFKPGTLVRIDGASKVYVIGSDNKLHWIVGNTVANDLFGKGWSANIVALGSSQVIDYGYGGSISSTNDMAKTVMIATVK